MKGIKAEDTEKVKHTNGDDNDNDNVADAASAQKQALVEASLYIKKQLQKADGNTNTNGKSVEKTKKKRVAVKPYPKVEPPTTNDRLKHKTVFGLVRGTPYGACLENYDDDQNSAGNTYNNGKVNSSTKDSNSEYKKERDKRTKHWKEWRKKNFTPVHVPVEGFDHIYGTDTIREDDYGAEAAAMAAHNPMGIDGGDNDDTNDTEFDPSKEGREYGSIRTPLDAPIGALKDKWRVLPHFLQVRSLMRQHIDSFDYFVNTEMKEIVQSPSACEIRSEHDPKFYLRYTDCWVGEPSVQEDSYTPTQVTPFQCRLRDCTYSAPIYVNIRYTRGRQIVVKKKVSLYEHRF
jgi:hypothetical protein